MFLLTLLAVTLFVRLGMWQLERGHEKQQLLNTSHAEAMRLPTSWRADDALPKQYQTLRVRGHFLPTTVLLDNQHHQHQFGYDVLSPLVLTDGPVVLVDRGWIMRDPQGNQLPNIDIPTGDLTVLGSAYYPSSKHWVLGQALEEKRANLAVVELLDMSLISQFLHKSVYPFIIRQNKADPHGFVREWAIVSMPPTRHYGYAVQWFAIALVIFIMFIALNLKHTGNT